ncbi:MAG: hypothetical protein IKN04_21390 [Clostridia bacterium]|nr:hypothetical protein [Clostridia bacterium]
MDTQRYDDILHLPRPVSPTRRHMPPLERAAQFSPFAALTGYDAAIGEAARITEEKTELDEWELAELNEKLRRLLSAKDHPLITVTYFQPDSRKQGGAYMTVTEKLKRIRLPEREMVFMNGAVISLDAISALSGPFFTQGNEDL